MAAAPSRLQALLIVFVVGFVPAVLCQPASTVVRGVRRDAESRYVPGAQVSATPRHAQRADPSERACSILYVSYVPPFRAIGTRAACCGQAELDAACHVCCGCCAPRAAEPRGTSGANGWGLVASTICLCPLGYLRTRVLWPWNAWTLSCANLLFVGSHSRVTMAPSRFPSLP